MTSGPTPYDTVPYPTFSHAQLHPDRIGTVAWLLGIDAAPAEECRYLELGCGDGGTLVALAQALPRSTFVGYDLAPTAVERAERTVQALGLPNVEVRLGDVAELPADLGEHDYIVSHGVFSWVPEDARQGILATFARHLAPEGVAYLSYNANPSGLLREMSRQMLRYHVGRTAKAPDEAYAEARNLLGFVSASRPEGDPWRVLLESELRHLEGRTAPSFVHDELAEVNTSFWLHEVLDLAAAHGLRFLGEAEDVGTSDLVLTTAAQALLLHLEDEPEVREQYLDFFLARRFRQTLLCRADRSPVRPVDPARLREVLVATPARPVGDEVDLEDGVPLDVGHRSGLEATVTGALAKAAIVLLGPRWPAAASFPSVVEGAQRLCAHVRPSGPDDERELAEALLRLVAARLVRLSRQGPHWPQVADDVADRPVGSPLARLQAGLGTRAVVNLRAEPVELDAAGAAVLVACDGSRDRAALAEVVAAAGPEGDPTWIVEEAIRQLAAAALLAR